MSSIFRPSCWILFGFLSFLTPGFCYNPFSLNDLQGFYEGQFSSQSDVIEGAFRPVVFQTAIPVPIPGMLGYAPLIIQNSTGLSSDRLYVVGKGQTLAATDA